MPFLIGTDEAGYGPNLGPLVVSATVWHVADGVSETGLYDRLRGTVATTLAEATRLGPVRVAIADSKVLYQSGKGLGALERGLLAALGVLGRHPESRQEVWAALAPESLPILRAIPWYAEHDGPVPIDCRRDEIEPCSAALAEGLARAQVRLVDVRSRAIFEEEFNRLCRQHGSKGSLLSHATLRLVAEVLASVGDESVLVVCDKHGGRNRYAGALSEHFPECYIEVRGESRHESVYRFGSPDRRVEFRFQAKGESHLPAALASMASKYLRELAMQALNEFWARRIPGLLPTAGYPVDARRFKRDIATVQAGLGIADPAIWRSK
ncbi:MAG: hypothetical protein NUV77_00785 [Thermoguttaceae bacterium]|jgi:ribonuclease HII|nr:hypothetical protein [Thermoguttaceae bacterium]